MEKRRTVAGRPWRAVHRGLSWCSDSNSRAWYRIDRAAPPLRKGWSLIEAEAFAQKALAWVGQTLNKWLWS